MIERLPFGRTGHLSTRTLFGAAALGNVTQDEADRTMELLLRYGVNHIDTAASYGESEVRIGPWMERHRGEFFLATKTGDRDRDGARQSIERSLDRLRTDHIDLLQLHGVVEDAELEQVLGPGGALEALLEARRQGTVRFIGITSHTLHAPAIHHRALARFPFDSVLLPCNYMLMRDGAYREAFDDLASLCRERQIAVQIIKTGQRRPYRDDDARHATWYKPFEDPRAMAMAIHWALGREGLFLNTPGDIHILPMVLDAANRYEGPPSDASMEEMLSAQEAAPLWA
jgi:aryl-alcohol dehydrogenase-like predicted oxidoreductase